MWGAIATGISGIAQSILGNKQRNKDYERQKKDQLDFWHMTNSYNSPENQMRLLQEAGLNPNLMYGGKGFGGASAASPISTPDLQTTQYRNPIGDILDTIGQYQDVKVKSAQSNNLRAQADKLDQDAMFTKLKSLGQQVQNARSEEELDEWLELKDSRMEAQLYKDWSERYKFGQEYDEYQVKNIKKQIFYEAKAELKKYASKLPQAEYELLRARAYAIFNSGQLTQITKEYYALLKQFGMAGQVARLLLGR